MRATVRKKRAIDPQAMIAEHSCEMNNVTYGFSVQWSGREPRWSGPRRCLLALEVLADSRHTGHVFHVVTSADTDPTELLSLVTDGFLDHVRRNGLPQAREAVAVSACA